tara:strand:- start:15 stop:269 length:255 start_codon:yes stop_codon:yes gene_type:complete
MERQWTPLEQAMVDIHGEDLVVALEKLAKKSVAYSCTEYHKGKFISGCYYCNLTSALGTKDELTQRMMDLVDPGEDVDPGEQIG